MMEQAYKDYTFNINVFRGEYVTLKMGPRGILLNVTTQPELNNVQPILQVVAELIESISIIEGGGLFYADTKAEEPKPNTDGE